MNQEDGDSYEGFRSLVLWQKAQDLAVAVASTVENLPNRRNAGLAGAQLFRAAGSISANVAEGYGRFSDGAFRNHLSIARGSLFETESWLDLLVRSGAIPEETAERLYEQCHEVGRMLTARMKQLSTSYEPRIREDGADYAAASPDKVS